MARLQPGIIGPISGKIGNVIAATRKGVPYLRALPRKRRKKASDKELVSRKRFADAQQWLKPVTDFVRAGFKGYSPTVEGFIAAKSHLLKHSFVITDAGHHIDPARAVVSFGDLPLPDNIRVEKRGDDELLFTWNHNPDDTDHKSDQAMLLAYNIGGRTDETFYNTTGQLRYTGMDVLKVYHGIRYHVYIAFIAADRSRQSMSLYLGEIVM